MWTVFWKYKIKETNSLKFHWKPNPVVDYLFHLRSDEHISIKNQKVSVRNCVANMACLWYPNLTCGDLPSACLGGSYNKE